MDLAFYKPGRGTDYIYTKEGQDPSPLYQLLGAKQDYYKELLPTTLNRGAY